MADQTPIIDRLALIGVGLIGGSIARAAREYGVVRSIVATARSEATRRRVIELGIADQVVETNAEAAKDADLVIICIPVGASGPVAAEIAASLKPGAIVSDVGSVKSAVLKDMAPHVPAGVHLIPAHPVAGTENSGPGLGLSRAVRQPLVHPDAAGGRRRRGGGKAARVLDRARGERRDHDRRASRHGAGDHQPPAAPDRLYDRRHRGGILHRVALRGAEILRRRLPRFHPHRGVRSDHVARRVPAQQGSGAGDARAVQRGPVEAHPRDAARRRRGPVRPFHPHARDPPRHRADRPGFGRARLRPRASGQARWRRSRGPTRRTTSRTSRRLA